MSTANLYNPGTNNKGTRQMTEQLKPRKLAPGARIGIVNPAYWLEQDRLHVLKGGIFGIHAESGEV